MKLSDSPLCRAVLSVKANVYVCVIRAGIDLLTGQPWEAL